MTKQYAYILIEDVPDGGDRILAVYSTKTVAEIAKLETTKRAKYTVSVRVEAWLIRDSVFSEEDVP